MPLGGVTGEKQYGCFVRGQTIGVRVEEDLSDRSDVSLSALRHQFHRFPELGFQEDRAKAKVASALRDLGLEIHEGVGVFGDRAVRKGKPEHRIARR